MLKYLEDQWAGIMSKNLFSQTIGMMSIIVVGHMGYLACENFFFQQFNIQTNVGEMGCQANRKLENWLGHSPHSILWIDLFILIKHTSQPTILRNYNIIIT